MPALEFIADASKPLAIRARPQAAVDARELSVEYEGRVLLDKIDLSLVAGQITWLLGANGTGKTTLLRCLAGIQRPTSGTVHWFGLCPHRKPTLRRLIGMVAHQSLLYPELTPRENLLFAAQMCDVRKPDARVRSLLVEAGLQWCADRPTSQLSNGWRQRVSIARALAHEPPILLMDEPQSGLDEESQHWLERLLEKWCDRPAAVCLTAHEYRRRWRPTDLVLQLRDGTLNDHTVAVKTRHTDVLFGAEAA